MHDGSRSERGVIKKINAGTALLKLEHGALMADVDYSALALSIKQLNGAKSESPLQGWPLDNGEPKFINIPFKNVSLKSRDGVEDGNLYITLDSQINDCLAQNQRSGFVVHLSGCSASWRVLVEGDDLQPSWSARSKAETESVASQKMQSAPQKAPSAPQKETQKTNKQATASKSSLPIVLIALLGIVAVAAIAAAVWFFLFRSEPQSVIPEASATEVAQVEEPKANEPVAEEPKVNEPVAEEPKANEPVAEEPKANEPVAEEPKANEPVAEEPKANEPVAEEPKANEPVAEEPQANETVVEKPNTKKSFAPEVNVDETKVEEPQQQAQGAEPEAATTESEETNNACKLTETNDALLLKNCLASSPKPEQLEQLAQDALVNGRCDLAKRLITSLGRKGNANLAMLYAKYADPNVFYGNNCILKDANSAIYWYQKVLESGNNPEAQSALDKLQN